MEGERKGMGRPKPSEANHEGSGRHGMDKTKHKSKQRAKLGNATMWCVCMCVHALPDGLPSSSSSWSASSLAAFASFACKGPNAQIKNRAYCAHRGALSRSVQVRINGSCAHFAQRGSVSLV
eukprot:1141292-Pelagomonas_calceolata.AAC.3